MRAATARQMSYLNRLVDECGWVSLAHFLWDNYRRTSQKLSLYEASRMIGDLESGTLGPPDFYETQDWLRREESDD